MTIRIIPRLDIKGPNLVKGIHLEGLRVLGYPEEFAKFYYEQGADELIYQDTVASLYERNSLTEIVTKTAKNIFIPLTVGGGIRTLEDINLVLRAGADKVAINTAATKRPVFIEEASKSFGSSTIVVAIEAIKQADGSYLVFTDNGREHTGINAISWAKEVQERGAGEILLTSIEKEGTGEGFDLELTEKVTKVVTIPVIAHGGACNNEHIYSAIKKSNANAIAISSMLHYTLLNQNFFEKSLNQEGNTEFIRNNKSFKMFGNSNISGIKEFLINKSIDIRV